MKRRNRWAEQTLQHNDFDELFEGLEEFDRKTDPLPFEIPRDVRLAEEAWQ